MTLSDHRVEAIRAYEAEFDAFVNSDVQWGLQDQFFVDDGHVYYYKPWLEKYLQEDIEMVKSETVDGVHKRKPIYDQVVNFLGYDVPGMTPQPDLKFVREMILKRPAGLPELLLETPMFFQFKIDGSYLRPLNIDNINQTSLDGIKKDIRGEYNPFLTPYFAQSLYYTETRYYCMDIFAYYYNPKAQFGMLLDPQKSSKYPNARHNSYFFTFEDASTEEKDFALLMGKLHTDYPSDTIVVEYKNL
jgi:hypothetical protein